MAGRPMTASSATVEAPERDTTRWLAAMRRGACPTLGRPMPTGDGLLARCLQHEFDHLEGMLYIDRLSARARKKVLKAWAEEHEAL